MEKSTSECLVEAGYLYTEVAYNMCVDFVESGDMTPISDGRPQPEDVWNQATDMVGEIFGFGPWDQYIDVEDEDLRKEIDFAVSNMDFESIQSSFIKGVKKWIHALYSGVPELEEWETKGE